MSALEDIAKVLGFPFKDNRKVPNNFKSFLKHLYFYLSGEENFSLENLAKVLGFSFSPKGDDCEDLYNLLLKIYRFLGGKKSFRSPYIEIYKSKACEILGGGGAGGAFRCRRGGGRGIVCESYSDWIGIFFPGDGKQVQKGDAEIYYIYDSDIYALLSKGLSCRGGVFHIFVDCSEEIRFWCPKTETSFSVPDNSIYSKKECSYSVHSEITLEILTLLGGK